VELGRPPVPRCASPAEVVATVGEPPAHAAAAMGDEYGDDDFEDEEPVSSPPPAFEARPPPGQSPVQLGVMRSPRAPPKIDVKPVRCPPARESCAPAARLPTRHSRLRLSIGEPHHHDPA
jgi:hypothetical protein